MYISEGVAGYLRFVLTCEQLMQYIWISGKHIAASILKKVCTG